MADTDYEKLTVAKLREVFKERGIPATGLTRKQQLIDKLNEEDGKAAAGEEKNEQAAGAGGEVQAKDEQQAVTEEADDAESLASSKTVEAAAEVQKIQEEHPEGEVVQTHEETVVTATQVADAPAEASAKLEEEVAEAGVDDVQEPIELPSKPVEDVEPVQSPAPTPAPEQSNEVEMSGTKSPTPRSLEEDSRKRKRRSATSPVDEEAVESKRQKQVHEPEHVIEKTTTEGEAVKEINDQEMEDIATEPPASTNDQQDTPLNDLPSKEDAIVAKEQLPEQSEKAAEAATAAEESAIQSSSPRRARDARFRNLNAELDTTSSTDGQPNNIAEEDDRHIPPAQHPATSTIYIRNLKRPVRPDALRSHLHNLSSPLAASGEDAVQEDLEVEIYLDPLKTHAYAKFPTLSHAARVRARLHDTVWPAERERDPLFVDFIGDDQFNEFVEVEEKNERNKKGGRWEVIYLHEEEGVRAELRDATAIPTGPRRRSVGTGPVGYIPDNRREIDKFRDEFVRGIKHPGPQFVALDNLFKSTDAKPRLYFQPVPESLARRRKEIMADAKSTRLPTDVGGGSGLFDSRRYTFEELGFNEGKVVVEEGRERDGGARGRPYYGAKRMVDNGPEFGLKVPAYARRRGGFGGGFRGRGR